MSFKTPGQEFARNLITSLVTYPFILGALWFNLWILDHLGFVSWLGGAK